MLLNTYTPYRFTYDLHFIDDRTLLIHDQDGIYCLDVDTLEKKWSYACRGVFIAVSEDRSKAALIDSDLTVLDTATGQPIMETSLKNLFSREQYIFGKNIVFSENGSCVFFTIDDRIVAKVDIDRKELVQVYLATYDFVTGLAVSPDDRVAITSFDSEMENAYGLIVYDASGNTLYSATSADEIDDPSFIATDSDLVVYISYENLVILDIGHGNRHICAHGDIVTDYYAIDDLIITATYNGSIRFWEADGTEYSLFRIDLGMYISTVDFVPGIITLKSEKDVVLLKPFENSNALLLEGHNEFIGNIAYLEGSKRAVSCSEYGEVILWDLERAEAVKSIHINERIRDVFSVDRGSKIMIFTDSYRLLLYDSATLDLIRSETFEGLYKLTMSPDHSLCILYGREGLIIDTCTLETVAAIPRIIFSDAAFFNDNSKIILGYNELYLLDIPGMTVLKEAEVPGIDMIRLSHDNSMLACISNKNSVKLFDTANLEEKLTIECPGPTPESVFFDPTGETLFVSFSDYTIGRYKTSDGTPVGILDKKVETVKDILFSQDRNIYITMGLNESYIWKLDTHKPIGHVRGLRNADLKSGCLYVDFFEKLFVLTLQDTKMLLDEAERQLQGRTLTPEEKKRLFIVE